MRARMQPSTVAMRGLELADGRHQRQRRRLEVVAGFAEPEAELRRPGQRIGEAGQAGIVAAARGGGTHRRSPPARSGLTSTTWQRRESASAAARSRRARALRPGANRGTSARRRRAAAPARSSSRERRIGCPSAANRRSAAAASAEPPPRPAATGRFLLQRQREAVGQRAGPAARGTPPAARSTRLPRQPPSAVGERPGDREAVAAGRHGLELVAEVGEGHQHFERVVAIGAAAGDVQRKVDLGGRRLDDRLGHRCVGGSVGGRPAWSQAPVVERRRGFAVLGAASRPPVSFGARAP